MPRLVIVCLFAVWFAGAVKDEDDNKAEDFLNSLGDEVELTDEINAQGNEDTVDMESHDSLDDEAELGDELGAPMTWDPNDYQYDTCKRIGSSQCKMSLFKKQCPCTCKQAGCIRTTKTTTTTPSSVKSLPMSAISDKLSSQEKLQVRRSKTYKKIWPKKCSGERSGGRTVNTDNFPCHKKHGTVADILSPDWSSMRFTHKCCQNKCMDRDHRDTVKNCPGDILTLADTAASAATGITSLKTASGDDVPLNVIQTSREERERTGLIAEVEVQALGGNLEFQDWKSELTPKGEKFLDELGEPLSMLLKLQLTAYDKNSGVKVLFCPHGATARDREYLAGHALEQLPAQRADVLGKKIAEMGVDGIGSIGTSVSHYQCEGSTKYAGEVMGAILYKIHEGSKPQTCDFDDFYKFKRPTRDDC